MPHSFDASAMSSLRNKKHSTSYFPKKRKSWNCSLSCTRVVWVSVFFPENLPQRLLRQLWYLPLGCIHPDVSSIQQIAWFSLISSDVVFNTFLIRYILGKSQRFLFTLWEHLHVENGVVPHLRHLSYSCSTHPSPGLLWVLWPPCCAPKIPSGGYSQCMLQKVFI